jgi:hypothetical protein
MKRTKKTICPLVKMDDSMVEEAIKTLRKQLQASRLSDLKFFDTKLQKEAEHLSRDESTYASSALLTSLRSSEEKEHHIKVIRLIFRLSDHGDHGLKDVSFARIRCGVRILQCLQKVGICGTSQVSNGKRCFKVALVKNGTASGSFYQNNIEVSKAKFLQLLLEEADVIRIKKSTNSNTEPSEWLLQAVFQDAPAENTVCFFEAIMRLIPEDHS